MSLWQRLKRLFQAPPPPAPDPTALLAQQMGALAAAIREAESAAALFRTDQAEAQATYDRLRAELEGLDQLIAGRQVQVKALLLKRGEHDQEAQRLVQETAAAEARQAELREAVAAAQANLSETSARLAEVESTLQRAKIEEQNQARLLQELRLEQRAGTSLAQLQSLTQQGEEARLLLEAQREATLNAGTSQYEELRQSAAAHEAQEAVARLKSQIRRPKEEGGQPK
jgi:chromosome segregation ATPase